MLDVWEFKRFFLNVRQLEELFFCLLGSEGVEIEFHLLQVILDAERVSFFFLLLRVFQLWWLFVLSVLLRLSVIESTPFETNAKSLAVGRLEGELAAVTCISQHFHDFSDDFLVLLHRWVIYNI